MNAGALGKQVNVRVLGCHGSNLVEKHKQGKHEHRTCGFLINQTMMVDAGTIGGALTLNEQRGISSILLSHLHFDHIQDLPTFADNMTESENLPISLISIAEVIDGLRQHVFNDAVYPNFLKLPPPQKAVFECRVLEPGKPISIGDLTVTAVRVNHIVPAVGFIIRDDNSSIVFSGDTYSTNEIWKMASEDSTLKAAFVETSFPNRMGDLALTSGHLTPGLLAHEILKLGRTDVPVYLYHMKPGLQAEIEYEVQQLGFNHVIMLQEDQTIII